MKTKIAVATIVAFILAPLALMAQTPDIPTADNFSSVVAQIIKLNDTFMGLPGTPLALVGCIVFGYFLKVIPPFPNKWIPVGVFLFGVVANSAMTSTFGVQSIIRGVILGLLVGGVAIWAHQKFLSKWIDDKVFTKLPLLAIMATLAIGMSGCAYIKAHPQAPEAIAQQVAQTVTRELLLAHPELKPKFIRARAELALIEAEPIVSAQDIILIISRLPVEQLQTSTARISIDGVQLSIMLAGNPALPTETSDQLRLIARGLGRGIDYGLPAQ